MLAVVSAGFGQLHRGLSADPEFKLYPFVKIVEGYSMPQVDGVLQNPSPYWEVGAGFAYEYLSISLSARSHFLSSTREEFTHPETDYSTEGHTVILVGHFEGKADVRPVRFVAGVDLGVIWFREFDVRRRSWSRSVLPVLGLAVDFRVPIYGKLAINTGAQYMVGFEGFQVSAKEYNSFQPTVGIVYDGALVR